MSKAILFLLSLFLLFSCGKNPFLNSKDNNVINTPGVTPGDEKIFLDIKSKVDFGALVVTDKKDINIEVENRGDIDIESFEVSSSLDSIYTLIEDTCSERILRVHEKCYFKYEFTPTFVGEHASGVIITAHGGKKVEAYSVELGGSGIDVDGPDSGVSFGYLKSNELDFGDVGVGSTFKKLIRITNSTDQRASVIAFRKSSNSAAQASYPEGDLGCSEIIESDCYLEVSLSPVQIGAQRDYIYLDYVFEGETQINTLAMAIDYNAKLETSCAYNYEQFYRTKEESDLSVHEKSLELPYYNKSRSTRMTIGNLLNTEYTDRIDIEGRTYLYIENAQVFISYGISLVDEIITDARLDLDLLKFVDAAHPNDDTEILCNLDMKICSGKRFTSRQNRTLINKRFFLKNKFFSDAIMTEGRYIEDILKRYELQKSFNLTHFLDMKSSNYTHFVKRNSSLSFAIADDTRLVSEPVLIVQRQKSSVCSTKSL